MKFRTPYDFDREEGIVFTEPSMTDQSEAPACDINRIVKQYETTGLLISPGQKDASTLVYGDATLLPDYETALKLVRGVNDDFFNLPSNVRAAFDHDPMNLLDAMQDPEQKGKLQELGLIPKDPEPNPIIDNALEATEAQILKNEN